jgi:nicotinate-nucleotide adenylyltransferase
VHDTTVIYGGSFDPPHMSHQMTCLYLLECLGAAEIWIIPSATHPFGKKLTAFESRYHMCGLLAAPFGERVKVLRTEETLGGAGRTYDTVLHLRQSHPQRKFALAMGADIAADTPRWYRWDDLVALLPIVVVGRSGYPHPHTPLQLPALSSRQVRALAGAGTSLRGLVPHQVARYITAQGLYTAPDGETAPPASGD